MRRVLEAVFAASVLSGLSMLVVSHPGVGHGHVAPAAYAAPAHALITQLGQATP